MIPISTNTKINLKWSQKAHNREILYIIDMFLTEEILALAYKLTKILPITN